MDIVIRRIFDEMRRQATETQEAREGQVQMIMIALGVVVILLGIIVLLVWMFSRRRHKELMQKVQEITSIRPMRELEGKRQPLLDTGGGTATESDLFTPQTPAKGAAAAKSSKPS